MPIGWAPPGLVSRKHGTGHGQQGLRCPVAGPVQGAHAARGHLFPVVPTAAPPQGQAVSTEGRWSRAPLEGLEKQPLTVTLTLTVN